MKNYILQILFLTISLTGFSQTKTIESDLMDLKMNVEIHLLQAVTL
ncbi:MAG: hypothetical protein CM15mP75_1380 [Flammeovirgaceae bacterium]|nr:MAG: hypothetical protein CM15mP75_1380 [Flammeovirgaceae bacterium]